MVYFCRSLRLLLPRDKSMPTPNSRETRLRGDWCMRIASVFLSTLVASVVPGAAARAEDVRVDVLLNDAQYAVNRYQELEAGVVCATWTEAPPSLQNLCAQEQRAIAANIERIKPLINRASKSRSPMIVDLLDIYDELHEVTDRLNELSNNVQDFAHQDGVPFAQAAAKTGVLDAKLFGVLRQRITSLENAHSR